MDHGKNVLLNFSLVHSLLGYLSLTVNILLITILLPVSKIINNCLYSCLWIGANLLLPLGKGKVLQSIYPNESRSSIILRLVSHGCRVSVDLNTVDNKNNRENSGPLNLVAGSINNTYIYTNLNIWIQHLCCKKLGVTSSKFCRVEVITGYVRKSCSNIFSCFI